VHLLGAIEMRRWTGCISDKVLFSGNGAGAGEKEI